MSFKCQPIDYPELAHQSIRALALEVFAEMAYGPDWVAKLADEAGVTKRAVYKWKAGDSLVPMREVFAPCIWSKIRHIKVRRVAPPGKGAEVVPPGEA